MDIKEKVVVFLASLLFLSACQQEDLNTNASLESENCFYLYSTAFDEGEITRSSLKEEKKYDFVKFYFMNEDGVPVQNMKAQFDAETSTIKAEGLHTGHYQLLVLAVKGNYIADRATIYPLASISDQWISFPEDLNRPLSAEYYYACLPFEVVSQTTPQGSVEMVSSNKNVRLKRFVGRMDFRFSYNNPYVRTAVTGKTLILEKPVFYTGLSGKGEFMGTSQGDDMELSLFTTESYLFMPTVSGSSLRGKVEIETGNYTGSDIFQEYVLSSHRVEANKIGNLNIDVKHPDDNQGVMFFTKMGYEETKHGLMFQDGEHHSVYTNKEIRSFRTINPLQLKTTGDSLLLRFFSPKPLKQVLVRAYIPKVCNEPFDIAYFEEIPGFAEMTAKVLLTERKGVCRTVSGKMREIPQLTSEDLKTATFEIESEDNFWNKLNEIKVDWGISFNNHNSDPITGTPWGSWLAGRPVHCREYVSIFLNTTYMISRKDFQEEVLKHEGEYKAGNTVIPAERVLSQLLERRNFSVSLCSGANGLAGPGDPAWYGLSQGVLGWHSTDAHTIFHELGHVMGYSHESTMTYGFFAETLCGPYFVRLFNAQEMPIESLSYTNYKSNPNLY